jgi:hypothetical protein
MPTRNETALNETALLDGTAPAGRATLPKLDYFLLPLLSLFTIIVLFGAAEVVTRILWPAEDNDVCLVTDSIGSYRARPNCTVRLKNPEGPWATYHYNECGYRTYVPCGPKPPGTIRIALLGSSISQGLDVPYEQTFATRAAFDLARATGHDVQIENLGMQNVSPLYCYRRLGEALALQPDLIVYAITPFDVEQNMDPAALAHRNDPNAMDSKPAVRYPLSWLKLLQYTLNESRAVVMAQHFLFSNTETFVRLFMNYGDKADYLRQPLTPAWQTRFANLNLILTDMAARSHQAGVPLIIMAAPSRPEAALANLADRPPHTNPFTFNRRLGEMAAQTGAAYIDAVDEFSRLPHSEQLFYVVDQHITPEGQAVLSDALVRKCLDGSIPAFATTVVGKERINVPSRTAR